MGNLCSGIKNKNKNKEKEEKSDNKENNPQEEGNSIR